MKTAKKTEVSSSTPPPRIESERERARALGWGMFPSGRTEATCRDQSLRWASQTRRPCRAARGRSVHASKSPTTHCLCLDLDWNIRQTQVRNGTFLTRPFLTRPTCCTALVESLAARQVCSARSFNEASRATGQGMSVHHAVDHSSRQHERGRDHIVKLGGRN